MRNAEPLSKKQIKALRLLGKRSERYARGRFIVEGERAVRQILANGRLEVQQIIVDESRLDVKDSIPDADVNNVPPCYTVTSDRFRRLTDTRTAQGVLAVCAIPEPSGADELMERSGMLFAADRIQDPGNMGTMIRTAVWFGVRGMVVSPGTVDLFHPKVVRSTAGSTGVLPWLESDLPEFLMNAREAGWNVHLLDAGPGAYSYRDMAATGKDILVVGNEANGIDERLHRAEYAKIRIDHGPLITGGAGTDQQPEGVESLNASAAAAIAMAHFAVIPSD